MEKKGAQRSNPYQGAGTVLGTAALHERTRRIPGALLLRLVTGTEVPNSNVYGGGHETIGLLRVEAGRQQGVRRLFLVATVEGGTTCSPIAGHRQGEVCPFTCKFTCKSAGR